MLLGDENPEFGISPEAQQMFEEANNNADYEPVNGDFVAFLIYSDGYKINYCNEYSDH